MPPKAKKRKIEAIDLTSETESEGVADMESPSNRPATHARPDNTHSASQSSKKSKQSAPARQSLASEARSHTRHELPTPPTSSAGRQSESWFDDDEDVDGDTEVNGSQEFDDNMYQTLELYGKMQHKIVGVRFYNGRATLGERVMLRREPTNQVCFSPQAYDELS